jgi:hypothetical protein
MQGTAIIIGNLIGGITGGGGAVAETFYILSETGEFLIKEGASVVNMVSELAP